MEIIELSTVENELATHNADVVSRELILNNVRLYNDLIYLYQEGNFKNLYLTYQLNVQIVKQLLELKKVTMKAGSEDDDSFMETIRGLKPNIELR